MCRSSKTLRPPFTDDVAAFEAPVDAVTAATQVVLRDVVIRGRAV